MNSAEDFYRYVCTTPMYVNLPMIIATHYACPLTVGKGLLVNAKNEELQTKLSAWLEQEDFYIKAWKNEQWCSVIGRSVMYLLPTADGGLTLRVATWNIMNRISTVDEQEQIAVIYDQPYRSDISTYQKITFTPGHVQVETYSGQMTMVEGVSAEVPANKRIKSESFETGLDFVPFIEFTNLPMATFFANTNLVYWPDWLWARQLNDDFQEAIKIKRKERIGNRTRLKLNYNMATLKQAETMGISKALRELADADVILNENNVAYADKQQGNNLGMLVGDPHLDLYNQDIWNTFEMFVNFCGYDVETNSANGAQYRNKTESLMNVNRTQQTTSIKQKYRITKWLKLLKFVAKHYGWWDGVEPNPFSIEVIPVTMVDRLKQMEEIEAQIGLGLLSRAEAISQIQNIPLSQAEEKLKEIDKDQEAVMQREMKYSMEDGDKGLSDEVA